MLESARAWMNRHVVAWIDWLYQKTSEVYGAVKMRQVRHSGMIPFGTHRPAYRQAHSIIIRRIRRFLFHVHAPDPSPSKASAQLLVPFEAEGILNARTRKGKRNRRDT